MLEILHTPSAIRRWWKASRAIVLPGEGGVWAAAWGPEEDDPDYVMTFVIRAAAETAVGGRQVLRQSGPTAVQGRNDYGLSRRIGRARGVLRVIQDGLPAEAVADEFFGACDTGSKDTFQSIREYLS